MSGIGRPTGQVTFEADLLYKKLLTLKMPREIVMHWIDYS